MESVVRYSLCPACDACPEVVVYPDRVVIGEGENAVALTPQEWNRLVEAVRAGALGPVEECGDGRDCC